MKSMFKSFSMLAVAACAGMSITSCTADKDLYNPEVAEQNVKSEYEANFIKKYGMVSPEQTWDFSSPAEYVLPGAKRSTRTTRGINPTVERGDWYEVDKTTLNWMTATLTEGDNHKNLGNPFVMRMPNNSFTIVPIFVGKAGLTWDLYMVTQDENGFEVHTKIWQKGTDVQKKANANSNWATLGDGYNDTTIGAYAVQSVPYTIDNVDRNTVLYFYLEVTKNDPSYATIGTKQSSLKHMMLALDVPKDKYPKNIDPKNEIMIIGCEDADLSGSDWDYNDVVFMIYGNPEKPRPERIDEIDIKKETRYMIEDLGATDDFDFNDIVIDLNSTQHVKYTYDQNDNLIDTEYGELVQKATLKHLGGILPYTVTIGRDTNLPWNTPVLSADPTGEEYEYIIPGNTWSYENNNLTVFVQDKQSEYVHKIPFPKAGEIPMIIAVSPSQNWMGERQSVPEEWIKK